MQKIICVSVDGTANCFYACRAKRDKSLPSKHSQQFDRPDEAEAYHFFSIYMPSKKLVVEEADAVETHYHVV